MRIGIDIGGAFTDLVAYDPSTGKIAWVKVETTPMDFSIGVLNCIEKSGIDLKNVDVIIHGQTLVVNTIVERKGAKVGLITTRGFRDILELQRSNRRDQYNFRYKKPDPIVPRYLRLEVDERITSEGEVLRELKREDVEKAVKKLLEHKVEVIAISFINSYANPKHEKEAAKIVSEMAGNIYVCASHEVTREWREYERTMTTVLNAYTIPRLAGYLSKLENEFKKRGFKGTPLSMLSSGGTAPFQYAARFPITTMESGPVAGVIGAIAIAEMLGIRNIIALDGGSTTTKASLVQDLTINVNTEHYIGRDKYRPGYPVFVPTVDTVEVGNGGTSIAWIDSVGRMRVGPRAAGAYPGPACYGKGGKEPTVTDAYVVAGLLNPRYLLGGELKIDRSLAEKALKPLADHFNMSIEEVADGVIKLANDNASHAIRLVSVQRGYDPRDFVLIAYGGSGPMFAPFIMNELEISQTIVPTIPPGVFSAWGMLVADIRHDLVRTNVMRLDEKNIAKINEVFGEMERQMVATFKEEGFGEDVVLFRYADLRYYGQEHTVKVEVPSGFLGKKELEVIRERFHEAHERKYAFKLPDSPVEIVNFHVTGIHRVKKPTLNAVEERGTSIEKALKEERDVYLYGRVRRWPIYDRSMLPLNRRIRGPLIIEDPTATIIALEGQSVYIDKYGNIVIRRGE